MTKTRTADYIIPISIILILGSIWLFSHPYMGITHDARLYGLQALSHIYPAIFQNDIFLKYASQENYTVFTKIFVFVIHLTGFSTANILLFAIGHLLWFVSVYLLCSLFYRGPSRFLSFAFVAMMPAYFSSNQIFSFGESFLTPRLFAEAFVLFSIYFVVRGKLLFCTFSLFVTLLIHPIIAGTALGFIAIYFLFENGKWVLTAGLVLMLFSALMVLLKVPPFDGMFRCMDGDWADIVQNYTGFLFLGNWTTKDYLPIVTSFVSIATYCLIAKGKRQRIALSVAIATVISLVLSIVFGDLVKNILILQIQIWRTSWLLLFFGHLAFLSIYVRIRKYFHFNTSFLIVCCASWSVPYISAFSVLYPLLLLVVFISLLVRNNEKLGKPLGNIIILKNRLNDTIWDSFDAFMSLFCALLLAVDYINFTYRLYSLQDGASFIGVLPFFQSFIHSLLASIICFIFLWYQIRSKDKRLVVISFGIFFFAISIWDQRLEYEQLISASFGKEQSWARNIPHSAEVLWPGFPDASWFLLNRKNYVSSLQSSGVVFSRETAILLKNRMKSTASLKELENPVKFYKNRELSLIHDDYLAGINKSCTAASDLNFIVIPHEITAYNPRKIELPSAIRVNRLYLTGL
jgi:hypothetical protein